MFIAPRKPMAQRKRGLENVNSIEVKMPYTEKKKSKAPTGIIKPDKRLPIFPDALNTSNASFPVVSFRSTGFSYLKGASTTISFVFFLFLFFFGISTTKNVETESVKKSCVRGQ
jgi:hypothetical protein